MKKIKGYWYPENSAAREIAELLLVDNKGEVRQGVECQLLLSGKSVASVGYLQDWEISDRVGNIPRKITLLDGSIFETKENDILDAALKANNHQASNIGILHVLETRWKWIATALVLTWGLLFIFFKWGLPWGANQLAYAMPVSATQKMGDGVLELMDKIIFDASKLPIEKQNALRQHFQSLHIQLDEGEGTAYHFTLHFRQMMGLPNAMALPSGDIILTDKLIEIAQNLQEIDAVLLHEIGHVVHRHSLQQVIQSTFVSVLLASIMGDVSGSSDVLVAFPAFLLQSTYARHHETDADDYAFKQMMVLGIDPKYFAAIMQRMIDAVEAGERVGEDVDKTVEAEKEFSDYFSSHPVTHERIKRALEYSEKFNTMMHESN